MKRNIRRDILFVTTLLSFNTITTSGELVYQPINPNFGGNPLNGSYLLNSAQAQNTYTDPDATGSAFTQRSALDRNTDSL